MATNPIAQFDILLVEDNPADIALIREALLTLRKPYNLQSVKDGASALEHIFSCDGAPRCPSLIILDLNLPKKSGHEVLQRIKSDERTKRVPVIVMSSSANPSDIEQAYGNHANCYVVKPHDLDQLFRITVAIESFWFDSATLPERIDPNSVH